MHIPGQHISVWLRLRLMRWYVRGYRFAHMKQYETVAHMPASAIYYRKPSGKEKCIVVHAWLHQIQVE